jgi:CRISPR-associated protein Cas5h
MQIIIFELEGKFAHFRKFFTNSSSLSYAVPPRTVVQGIVAAVLGMERNSYYEILSKSNANIAIEKISKTRKINQVMNYVMAKNVSEIVRHEKHTQVPIEIIAGFEDNVRYRIYFNHIDEELNLTLLNLLRENKSVYPLYFGAAPFFCKTRFIDSVFSKEELSDNFISVNSIIRRDLINDVKIDLKINNFHKEKMPVDFDKNRFLIEAASYVYDDSLYPIEIKTDSFFYKIGDKNIIFT